ncbi:hypothetical protein PIB30_000280 [Stylosanthes scabra]|uniref:Uncharacterized protein n=1 Tax=Stylosanthes scabra TaxID=79078 RepID=A0ABU6T2Y9_9FABA|nr:hypothetical protein [Stylosanthes scabra]
MSQWVRRPFNKAWWRRLGCSSSWCVCEGENIPAINDYIPRLHKIKDVLSWNWYAKMMLIQRTANGVVCDYIQLLSLNTIILSEMLAGMSLSPFYFKTLL